MAARISCSLPWPDDPDSVAPLGDVLLFSAEDDLEDTIRPRLDAAGADVKRIAALGVKVGKDGKGCCYRAIDLARDLADIKKTIGKIEDCQLVIIDPLSAYIGSIDSHRDNEVRALLAPLADLASKHDVAVLAVMHLRKSEGPAIYRNMGSLAFTAAARAAWVVAKDKADPERRLFLPVKNNLALDRYGLAYCIFSDEPDGAPVIEWDPEPVTMTADEALESVSTAKQGGGALGKAIGWLRAKLADGPVPANELEEQALQDGITKGTYYKARSRLGVRSTPAGYGGSRMCCLPDEPSAPSVSPSTQNMANTGETDETGEPCDQVDEANSALDEVSQDDDDVPW